MNFIGFGNPEEWKYFEENNKAFIEKYPHLRKLFIKVFNRKISKDDSDADRVIFDLGFICCEEFNELILLCANGYGIAAQKILRSIYEKAVTADYLHKFPDEATNFLEYGDIHLHKDLHHSKLENDEQLKEEIDYINENYNKIKDKFRTTVCKKCGTTRPMYSWIKYDTQTLAEKGESLLENFYNEVYFQPTMQSHTTILAILSRMNIDEKTDALYISDKKQRSVARSVLRLTHIIIFSVLDTQNRQFKLGIDDELMERAKDLELCWFDENNSDK